jgi:hypothetical protein
MNDSPSDEICPCCGIHFGYDDVASGDPAMRERVYREWRVQWTAAGKKWWSQGREPPPGWDPRAQLQRFAD